MDNNKDITYFGLTSFRNQKIKFGIKRDDRRRHFYTIGKTGMGKSNLMENMAIQDIQNGNGIAYVDPHGEGAEKLLDFIPKERIKDVIFFNPADLDFPIAFNVMEKVDFRYRHLVAGGLMAVFKKVWPDVWSARMEYILSNAILALLEYPDSTLLGINRMLSDPEYRARVVALVKDPIVKAFWSVEFARYSQKYETEATAAIQNKVGQFVSNALIRNVIGQVESTVNMRKIMDEGKILILDLSKGRIGEDNSRLLGALLITKIQLAAMSRVDIPEAERRDFYLYVDEFQNFATESFASILSEARKYRLNLIVGHQYITQMDEIVRDAVFGNVGTLAVFRIGAEDAEFLEREFSPEFTAEDLVNLSKYNIYLKLMIDGVASHPFSAATLAPPIPLADSNRDAIIEASRERYGVGKQIVEKDISDWSVDEGEWADEKFTPPGQKSALAVGAKVGATTIKVPPATSRIAIPSIQEDGTTLYSARCDTCGKDTRVIFEPTPGKPIYCKSCLKKRNAAKEAAKAQAEFAKSQIPNPLNPQSLPASASQINPKSKIQNIEHSSLRGQQTEAIPVKIENLSFNHSKPQNDAKPRGNKKEINLFELKKMIDESLKKESSLAKASTDAKTLADRLEDTAMELKKEEVQEKIYETVNIEETLPKPVAPKEIEDGDKKGIINPGQKINL